MEGNIQDACVDHCANRLFDKLEVMLARIKSWIRRAFYRSALCRWLVGCASVLSGRTRCLGVEHLLSYRGDDAIGPLQVDEALALFGIVRTLRPQTVVEFGFFHGHSAFNFLRALPAEARLFSYDIDPESARRAGGEFRFDPRFRFFGKSQDEFCAADVEGRMVDFVFFDAAHELELNVRTFERVLPTLAPSAMVAIHDTGLWHRSQMGPMHREFEATGIGEWVDPDHFAHQPGERAFAEWIRTRHPEFAVIHLHSSRVLRHGFSLLQRIGPG